MRVAVGEKREDFRGVVCGMFVWGERWRMERVFLRVLLDISVVCKDG